MMLNKFRCGIALAKLSVAFLLFAGISIAPNGTQADGIDEISDMLSMADDVPAAPETPEQPATPEPTPEPETPPAPAPESPAPAAPETPEQPATPEPTPEPETPPAPTPESPAPTAPETPEQPATPEPTPEPETPPAPTPESPAPATPETPEQQTTPEPTPDSETSSAPSIPSSEDALFDPAQNLWHTNSKFIDLSDFEVVSEALLNNPAACFEWGLRILRGAKKRKEVRSGIQFIQTAACADYPPAQLWISEQYRIGKYYSKDFRQSFLWCKLAAEQGQPKAQYLLALFYTGSRAVRPNSTMSAQLCKKSADNNYPPAIAHLGTLYLTGLGFPKNDKLAIQCFVKGALMSDAEAQYQLGMCYDKGIGVRANAVEAFKWLNLSAAKGNAKAVSERQKISKRLSKAELREGERLSLKFSQLLENGTDIQKLNPLIVDQPIENTVTGFLVTTNGHILTSYKPFEDYSHVYVRNQNGYFEAKLLKSDLHNNLAILKIDNTIKSITSENMEIEQITVQQDSPFKPLALTPNVSLESNSALFSVDFDNHSALVWEPQIKNGKLKDFIGINEDTRCLKIDIQANSHSTGAPIMTPGGNLIGILDVFSESSSGEKSTSNYHNVLRSDYIRMLLNSLPPEERPQPAEGKNQKYEESLKQVLDAVVQIIIF